MKKEFSQLDARPVEIISLSLSQLIHHPESPCCMDKKMREPCRKDLIAVVPEHDVCISAPDCKQGPLRLNLINSRKKRGRAPKIAKSSGYTNISSPEKAEDLAHSGFRLCDAGEINTMECDAVSTSIQPTMEEAEGCLEVTFKGENIKELVAVVQEKEKTNPVNVTNGVNESELRFKCKVSECNFNSQEKLEMHKDSKNNFRDIDKMNSRNGNKYRCQRSEKPLYAKSDSKKPTNGTLKLKESEVVSEDCNDESCRKLEIGGDLGKVSCQERGENLSRKETFGRSGRSAGNLPFECTICSEQFSGMNVLRRHLKVHLAISSHKCPVCQKHFSLKSTMQSHALREHGREAEKPGVPSAAGHQCRQFVRPSQLTAHAKLHDKKLGCPHPGCSSLFRYGSELSSHLRTHSDERHFLCDECGYSGKSRHQLKRHQRLHADDKRYRCGSCDYRTTLAANLRRHERVHTGSKPYRCLYCAYSCNTQENLRKHVLKTRRHAGKFLYPCHDCGFGTNSAQDFQRHLESEHQRDRQTLPSILLGTYRPEDGKDKRLATTAENAQNCLEDLIEKTSTSIAAVKVPMEIRMKQNPPKKSRRVLQSLGSRAESTLPSPSRAAGDLGTRRAEPTTSRAPQILQTNSLSQLRPLVLSSASQSIPSILTRLPNIVQGLNTLCLPVITLNAVMVAVKRPIELSLQPREPQSVSNESNEPNVRGSDAQVAVTNQFPVMLQSKQSSGDAIQTAIGLFVPGMEESHGIISSPGR